MWGGAAEAVLLYITTYIYILYFRSTIFSMSQPCTWSSMRDPWAYRHGITSHHSAMLYLRDIYIIIRWKFILAMRMTYIQDLKESLKAKWYKNSGGVVSDASCESTCRGLRAWAWWCEDFSSIVLISHVFLMVLYCILKIQNTFLVWLVASCKRLWHHIALLYYFTIALTWIDTYASIICIRIYIKTDGSENE